MALNNAYKMYMMLVKEHTQGSRGMLYMGDAVRELTHDLCQMGPWIRKLQAEHPSWTRDMKKLFGWISGRKICSDTFGFMPERARPVPLVAAMVEGGYALWRHDRKRTAPWMVHQSEPADKRGKCCWDDCLQSALVAVTHTCVVRSAAFNWGRMSSSATATSMEGSKIVTGTIIFIITIGTKLKY